MAADTRDSWYAAILLALGRVEIAQELGVVRNIFFPAYSEIVMHTHEART